MTQRMWVSALATIVSVAGLAVQSPSAEAAFPGVNSSIAFLSDRDGDPEIYTMKPNGSAVTQLTFNASNDGPPSWSADGRKIAFTSDRDGKRELYVTNANGSNQTRVTNNALFEQTPAWSPDGTRIVFNVVTFSPTFDSDIYTIRPNGSGLKHLTQGPEVDFEPVWSPDGAKIAFASSGRGGHPGSDIYIMNSDGSQVLRRTTSGHDDAPDWSPDGKWIVFASSRDQGVCDPNRPICLEEIYVMNADGTHQVRLTRNNVDDGFPVFSPDGMRVAFHSDRDDPDLPDCRLTATCQYEVYTMKPTPGAAQINLTMNIPSSDLSPDWRRAPTPRQIGISFEAA